MLATIYNFISIHAPPRGATSSELRRVARSRNFNSRPSARGDFRVMPGGYTPGNFNSRPSARGDSDVAVFVNILSDFNSRPSARGDANIVRNIPTKEIFQFTPLREGRPCPRPASPPRQISIHAPPRGATHMARICRIPSSFQFTPLREGRRILFPPTVLFSNFNSRPSARGDQQIKRITIFQHYFNSRPSARGDTRNRRHCWQWQRFQFTPLREGRHCTERSLKNSMYISIHAPPRGATRGARGFRVSGGGISIHAPPRGATDENLHD